MSQEPNAASLNPENLIHLASLAAADNYARLQDSQAEFLEWLEATERKAKIDRYNYKKIR